MLRLTQGFVLLPRSRDLLIQIHDIEARQEEYPETLAVLRLVNTLLEACAATLPAAAAALAPYTSFVINDQLRLLAQRGCVARAATGDSLLVP